MVNLNPIDEEQSSITGYEAVPCTENETEDSVRKCPVGHYQPDQTNSSNSPHCLAEPECTEEEIKKDLKCDDGYCWTVCICSLEVGKCGLDPLNCLDIKNIKCMGKVLQDCSCALPVVPTKLPTSPPTRSILSSTFKPINPDWTAKTLSPIPTDTTMNNDKTDVTKDGIDTGAKGNEVGYLIPVIIIIIIVLVILVVLCVVCVCKRRSNRSIEAGSHENLELGEATSNSINVRNGSEMESGRNINNSVGDDRDAGRGQSSRQVEVHNYSKPREEPTLAEEEDSFLESDLFLSPNEFAVTSLQEKKVAVVSPFNEVQTVPVEDSPAGMNAENQPLRGEDSQENGQNTAGIEMEEQEMLPLALSEFGLPSNGLWSNFSLLGTDSNISQAVSNIPQAASDIPQEGSDIPQAGSDIPQAQGVEPTLFSNSLCSDLSRSILHGTGSDVQAGSDIQQAVSDIQQAGSDIPQAGSDIPQAGSDIAQAGSDIAQAQSVSQRELDEEDDNVHQLLD